MGRIARSFLLFKASLAVLRQRTELAVFPLLAGIASLIAAVSFAIPIFAVSPDAFEEGTSAAGISASGYVLLFCMYMVLAFITIFFNAALIHAADQALRGQDPTVGGSLRATRRRVPRILPWALLSATVSLVLRALEERLGFFGRIAVALVGLAWTLVTYLVLPILVLEGVDVRTALRRSSQLFRGSWGEQVTGNAGIGLATFLLALLAVPVVIVGAAAGGAVLVVTLVLAAVWWIALAVLGGALSGIYQTALYHYVAHGVTPVAFAAVDMRQAFRPKRRRGH